MTTATTSKTCKGCGTSFTEEQSSGEVCFPCKIKSVGFTWRGPTRATRENFSNQTIREAVNESLHNEKRAGTSHEMDFVGKRWV